MTDKFDRSARGEPWGRNLYLAAIGVLIAAACLQSYGITSWPMADDEVPSLVEMGLIHVDAQAFSVPANQIGRLPRAVPVWYRFQRFVIDRLPSGELSYRLPSVVWGVLTSLIAFVAAARWRGLWFATALAIVMNLSQPFVYLSQLDRFYSLPLLLMTVVLVLMWLPRGGIVMLVAISVLTGLAVLSHNITLTIFALAFGASCVLYLFGFAGLDLPIRGGVAFAVSVVIYLFYLRPLVTGWASTGNPTPVLVSLTAHAGVPTLVLALFGCALALVVREDSGATLWWSMIFVGSLALLQFTSMTWNPRYLLFFLPAMWVLAARTVEYVGQRLDDRLLGIAWYGCVAMLLAPAILSHYQDGSRHDYRQAASVIMREDQSAAPILSDDAETISYYLPERLKKNLFVRTKVKEPPSSEFYLVARSNAWMPLPRIANRRIDLLAEIYRRRFDEFSHILRIYRVAPSGQP